MNPLFLSPRQLNNPNTLSVPLNNQKDLISTNVTNNGVVKFINSPPLVHLPFKTFNNKVNHQQPKINNSTHPYIKPSGQLSVYQSNINNFSLGIAKDHTEMMMSVISDSPKTKESNSIYNKSTIADKTAATSPIPRRQPRYSQPAQFQPPQLARQTKQTFLPLNKNHPEGKQSQISQHRFYKKVPSNISDTNKQQKQQKSRQWLKQIGRFKKNQKSKLKIDNFDKIKNLGKGKYGNVFLVRDKKTNYLCALKIIQKTLLIEDQIIDQFIRQVKIQMYLNHSNVIKMYGLFDDEKNIYIVLEVAFGGQLLQQIKKDQQMPQNKVAQYMKQVCTAVDQLHSSRIIHRDIKPQNIVLHEGVIKLCDFGWSVHIDNKLRTTFCGTPLYVCPQILKGDQYDEKIDIWSLGIMMYQMLIGQNPFKINKQEELIKIIKQDILIPSYVYISKEARDFLNNCLQKKPTDRFTIKELINHDFFRKNIDRGDKKISL